LGGWWGEITHKLPQFLSSDHNTVPATELLATRATIVLTDLVTNHSLSDICAAIATEGQTCEGISYGFLGRVTPTADDPSPMLGDTCTLVVKPGTQIFSTKALRGLTSEEPVDKPDLPDMVSLRERYSRFRRALGFAIPDPDEPPTSPGQACNSATTVSVLLAPRAPLPIQANDPTYLAVARTLHPDDQAAVTALIRRQFTEYAAATNTQLTTRLATIETEQHHQRATQEAQGKLLADASVAREGLRRDLSTTRAMVHSVRSVLSEQIQSCANAQELLSLHARLLTDLQEQNQRNTDTLKQMEDDNYDGMDADGDPAPDWPPSPHFSPHNG